MDVAWVRQRVRQRLVTIPAGVVDAGVAIAVAAVIVYRIWLVGGGDGVRPGGLAYGLGLAMAAALLLRRRWPVPVLAFTGVTWVAYHAFVPFVGGEPGPAVWVALYTAGAADDRRWLLPVAAWLLSSDIAGRLQERGVPLLSSGFDASTVLWLVALLLGDRARSRRLRLRQAEAKREQEAQRRVAEERLRIAREMHDVLAHTITAITVHAGVAGETFDRQPATARAALATIHTASRDAMTELRAAIGVLRHGRAGKAAEDDGPAPLVPALSRLDELVEVASKGGLRIDVARDGVARPLPAAVDLAAYRIVQESLANVQRHAQAATATVSIRYEPDGVCLEIADDGRGPNGAVGQPAGYGLLGMRERVAALGGRLGTGPRAGGGFAVRAWLPTGMAAS